MNTKTMQGLFSLRCLDPRMIEPLELNKKKLLVGSSELSDLCLPDKSISSYHAFICLMDDGFMVKDLFSEAGIFLNGKRIQESFVGAGDTLTFGTLSFHVETVESLVSITDPDQAIHVNQDIPSMIELPAREGLVFIDGEYCDINFDESHFAPIHHQPSMEFSGEFLALDETAPSLDIAHSVKSKRLEIISYMNGMVMDVSYLNLKDGDYSLAPLKKSSKDIIFHTIAKTKIFTIKNEELRFYPSEALSPSLPWDSIRLDTPFFLTSGAEQISLRLVDQSVKWTGLPFMYRDQAFYKQAGKVFATVFLPMLLLLLVTIPRPEEVQETVAVVYKLPEQMKKPSEVTEASEVKTQEVTSNKENTGHKENQQNPEKVEFAAASAQQKVLAKAAAPKAQATAAQAPAAKAYEFNSNVSMNSLVGDAPSMNAKGASVKSALSDADFNTGSSDKGSLVAGADIGVSKFNGSDKKGSGSGSFGSRGLAAKSGFDSSYLEPKTVVLGSMDPELLRKILREYIPQFRHCYQQELIAHSDKIKGIIDLNFTINQEGRVSNHNIRAKDARFSHKGIGCMGQVLSLIDFPKPKGGGVVDVKQPLNFFAETEKI